VNYVKLVKGTKSSAETREIKLTIKLDILSLKFCHIKEIG